MVGIVEEYFLFVDRIDEENCGIYDFPDGLSDFSAPAEGTRMGSGFPEGLEFKMALEAPGLKIPDLISNALGYYMVSRRLKALLEAHATAEIEFLRFTLLNHKGRVARDDCYIANVIGSVDCVDRARTEGRPDPVRRGRMMRITRVCLDHAKIDVRLNLFRIASRPRLLVIRADLRSVLEAEGITGADYLAMNTDVNVQ